MVCQKIYTEIYCLLALQNQTSLYLMTILLVPTLHPAVFRSLAEGTYQVIGNGCLPINSLPALNKAPGVLLMRTPSGGVGSGKKVT